MTVVPITADLRIASETRFVADGALIDDQPGVSVGPLRSTLTARVSYRSGMSASAVYSSTMEVAP